MDSGEVLPFGQNDHGQLGVGSTANRGDTPATVPASMGAMPLALAARQATGGAAFTAVVTSAGSIILVGSAAKGQLATGGIADIGADEWKPAPPVGVFPTEGRVVAAATGSEHTVLLTAKGRLLTFGSSTSGQLGRDSTTPLGDSAEETLQQLNSIELWQPAVAVAAGGQASAAVLADGGIVTFGMGTHGMLGLGDNIAVGSGGGKFSLAQAGMVPLGKRAVEASMGEDHTLVLSDAGQVFAFGKNVHGQLGTGSTEGLGDKGKTRAILALSPVELSNSTQAWRTEVRIAPQPRDGPTSEVVVGVAMGGSHTLALLEDGRVRPFGGNAKGQLGLGTTSSVLTARDTHLPTLDVGGDVSAVAAGNAHSIVLRRDGQVFAFGFGAAGQLGYESTANVGDGPSAMPASTGAVDFGGARAVAIAAGTEHSAVILSSGLLYAFGSGSFGQLGTGNLFKVGISGRPVLAHGRVPLGSARAVAVAAGFYHTLVLLEDGTVRSFGRAFHGQLGYGNTTELGGTAATTPEHLAPVPLGGAAVALAAGFHFSAVVLADGSLRTFGRGSSGQLGYGSTANAGGAASTTPALMGPVPVGGAALAVACGGYHTIVLMLDGTVAAMGNNSQGQLGLASFPSVGADPSALPRDAGNLAVGGRAVAVAAGGGTSAGSSRSAVLLEDGTLLTFGSNTDGAIGAGSAASRGQASNWAFASLKNDASLLLADSALDRPLSRPLTAAPPYLLTMGSPSLPDMSIRTYMRSAAGVRVTPTGDWPMTAGIHFASGASPVDLAPGADAATQACAIGVAGQVLGSSSVACGFEDARLWHAFDAAPAVSSVSLAVNGVESTEVDAKGDPTAELRFSVAGDFHWAALELGLGAAGGAQEAAACDASAEALQAFSSWGGGFVTAELQTRAVAAGAGAIPSCRLLSTAELQCFGQVLGARSNESDPMAVVLSPRCSAQQFRSVSIVPLRFPGPAVVSAWLEDDGATLQVLGRGFGSGSAALPVVNVNGSGECLPVVRHSDSELACSLGPGVGVDQQVVLHIDGMVASGAATVTFPAPEIISVSPAFILAGERGVNVTVTGRHLLLTSVPAHINSSSSSSSGGSSGGAALGIDAQLEAAAARGGGLWIGGQPCEAELIVVVPGSKMLCSGFDAPVVWPEARTVRVSVAGQVGVGKPGAFEGAPRPRVSFVSLAAAAGAAAEYRPGTMVSIRGSGFAPSPAGVSATVRIGGVVAAPVNTSRASQGILEVPLPSGVQGKASVVVTSAAGLLSSDAPGSAAVTVIMAPPVVAAAAVRPPGGDTFGEWLGLPGSQADAGEPAPPAALNASARLTGRGFLRTGVSGVRVGPLNCSDVVVLSDTSLECTVVGIESLRGLFPAADDALPDRLFVSFEWPTAGQRVESADAWVSPDWPPVVSAVAPAIASPGDDVVVLGRRFGPSAGRPASVQIGGLACPGLQWVASTVLRCTLPAGYRLESLPDRDGDALHVRVTSPLGASTTKPRAIRLSGSVAASLVGAEGGGLDPNEALVVLPSSDGDVIAVAAESGGALCIAAVGLGAQECGFDAAVADSPLALAGAGATAVTALLVGVSRQSVPRNVSVMKFPGTGVKAPFGAAVSLRPWCSSAVAGQSFASRNVSVVVPAVNVSWTWFSTGVIQTPLAVDPTPLPPVNATVTMDPPVGPGMAALVADRLLCQAALARLATGEVVATMPAQVSAEPGQSGRRWVVLFAALPLTFIEAGAGFSVRATCTWVPTGQVLELPQLTGRVARLRTSLSAVDPGAGVGPDGKLLLVSGVTRQVQFRVDAGLSDFGGLVKRSLRLETPPAPAWAPVAEGTEGLVLSAANEWTATVPVGVSGVGAGTVSVECSAWGGLQSWSSTSSVALRTGTLGMAMSQTDGGAAGDAGGGGSGVASRQLVLSSGASGFSVVPAVELRAVVAEAPAWPVANAGGISCGVAVPSLPASTTQSGTKTRFFASVRAGPTGAIVGVVFDALGLVGVASYPQLGQPVAFSLQCEHPDAGQLPPVQVETELVGLRAAWGRVPAKGLLPSARQWEPFDVEVFTGDGRPLAVPGVASAVRCVAAVGNGTRLEGASAAGAAPDAGRAAAEGMVARAEFRGFAVTGKRGAAFELRVTCSVGDLPLRPVLAHSFRLQGCSAGQQPREASEDLCEACGAGTYSDGGAGASCVPCPKTGASCAGGVLELRRGFYRPPAAAGLPFDGSTELHPCFNAEACTLNSTARRYGCAPGYTGPLCGVCTPGHALFGEGLRRGLGALVLFRAKGTALFQAVTGFVKEVGTTPASWGPVLCATGATFVTRFWATLVLPVVVMVLSVIAFAAIAMACGAWKSCDTATQAVHAAVPIGPSTPGKGAHRDVAASQPEPGRACVGTLASADPSRSRAVVKRPGQAAEAGPAKLLGSAMPSQHGQGLPSSVGDVLEYLRKHKYMVTLAMELYVLYMPLVSLGVTALECYDRPVGGRRYLRADLSVPCFEGDHFAVAVGAGVMLAVLGVGFPAGLVLALRGGRPAPSLRFLYEGYDEARGLRWWEALGLLRKMGLVMAAALVPDAASQVAAAVMVLTPALWAQTQFQPYRASKFNALETMSLLAMLLTATVSLLYLQAQGGEAAAELQTESQLSGWTDVVVTVALIGANGSVFALMILALPCARSLWRTTRGSGKTDRVVAARTFSSPSTLWWRKTILLALQRAGVRLVVANGLPSTRDAVVASARVLVNIHGNDEQTMFETMRCDRWIAAGHVVVSEPSWADETSDFRRAYIITPDPTEASIVATTQAVLKDINAVAARIKKVLDAIGQRAKAKRASALEAFVRTTLSHIRLPNPHLRTNGPPVHRWWLQNRFD
ncbi:hypothetical protein FNF28_07444 [Cafeteria roenbergensis]|uniref:RCC1-like domain-containing protein n=1 Tax=Cafeteria roenbergensis TaxID=33653 RepID=A0A5A8C6T4_CAFRO|nr:hypothetical protein FNF28_07444 [Cafeteria roenbergensis]